MAWIKERVWQLGIAVVAILVGAVLIYVGGAREPNTALVWAGLAVILAAMAVPVFARIYEALQEGEGERGEM